DYSCQVWDSNTAHYIF
nr:immunoglobulin light chain junction region [Macaca mulatta]MOX19069.1 immunoglobulin light chain junction region [Macaca mulatta]MOX19385.1 immunoglobulin light chain junction region [Macaca mulatta]MOX22344.1 immunoglobulin light chain junction region [Macaca mulatta]MOX22610.1 immunoglobulin light chain junction region [Macaca mulatta]